MEYECNSPQVEEDGQGIKRLYALVLCSTKTLGSENCAQPCAPYLVLESWHTLAVDGRKKTVGPLGPPYRSAYCEKHGWRVE